MQRPGQNIKTRTVNVDGIIKELMDMLEVRLNNTWNDWHDEEVLDEYLNQDLETFNGSVELMYKLNFIDKDRWDRETERGYNLYNKIAHKPRNIK